MFSKPALILAVSGWICVYSLKICSCAVRSDISTDVDKYIQSPAGLQSHYNSNSITDGNVQLYTVYFKRVNRII